MKSLYVLVVDNAWAKLYKTDPPPARLALVYHQALFGERANSEAADRELARNLCRLLRADRQAGKYGKLVVIATEEMLAALQREYDGDAHDVIRGRLEDLPARYSDEDIRVCVDGILSYAEQPQDVWPGTFR